MAIDGALESADGVQYLIAGRLIDLTALSPLHTFRYKSLSHNGFIEIVGRGKVLVLLLFK
jgi:hypothetical protein